MFLSTAKPLRFLAPVVLMGGSMLCYGQEVGIPLPDELFISENIPLQMRDYRPFNKLHVDRYAQPLDSMVNRLTLKFKDDFRFRLRGGVVSVEVNDRFSLPLPEGYEAAVNDAAVVDSLLVSHSLSIQPLFVDANGRSMEETNNLRRESGQRKAGISLADLNNYYTVLLPEEQKFEDVQNILNELNQIGAIEVAYVPPIESPDSVNTAMPGASGYTDPSITTQGSQGYLDNTNNGIHALDGWVWKGGRGENVIALGIDNNVNDDHIELFRPYSGYWDGIFWPAISDSEQSDHGSAIMGILASADDGVGTVGIVPNMPQWKFVSNRYCFGLCWNNTAAAINVASTYLDEGSIISISWGVAGPRVADPATDCSNSPDCNKLPAEWSSSTFSAIQTAVANGAIVVVSASNGYTDLDDPAYNDYWNMSVNDSGSIMVGAVEPYESAGKLPFSNYGSRVTSRGWGDKVATIGYNRLEDPVTGDVIYDAVPGAPWDEMYTSVFSGTSSAAPIVAGAAASVQSIATEMGWLPIAGLQMRALLANHGTPQTYDTSRNIGVMPDVDATASWLHGFLIDCDIGSNPQAQSGSFSLYNATVTNESSSTLPGWTAYIDFGAGVPSVQWSSNVTASTDGNFVVLEGTSPLAPFSSVTFSLGGQYSGPSSINLFCK